MIRRKRSRPGAEQGETVNYFASVSDLMSGLLFVFIIALTAALMNTKAATDEAEAKAHEAEIARALAQEEKKKAEEALAAARAAKVELESIQKEAEVVRTRLITVEDRLQGNNLARTALLTRLKEELEKKHAISVNIDATRGKLRIPEEAVTFEVGRSDLDETNAKKLVDIGAELAGVLPCYLAGAGADETPRCRALNPNGNRLDAVFIEGHTDNQQYRGDREGSRNRTLSTDRSNKVYRVLVWGSPALLHMKNDRGEALFSISGYGEDRPVEGHEHAQPTDDAANRRIEIRFVFAEPKMTEEENALIRKSLDVAALSR